MHDPDALYTPKCEHHLSPREIARRKARDHALALRYEQRMATIRARDLRWRRFNQSVLAAAVITALTGLGYVLWSISSYLDGGSLGTVDAMAAKITIPGLLTALSVLRMAWGWRKRRRAPAVVRAVDAASTLLPTTR